VFIRLWERRDVDGLAQLLTSDAVLAMPPTPAWFVGPAEIMGFLTTVPAGGQLERIRLLRTGANGQPAAATYIAEDDGIFRGYGLMVFEVSRDRIHGITGFADRRILTSFRLPDELGPAAGGNGLPRVSNQ
jgi:RNA polymerase sigma-70 factor (ECF subfamily)